MNSVFNYSDHPHRRRNPLTGDWVLVSPHRGKRPWWGQEEAAPPKDLPKYESSCYLCPGNPRMGGDLNPDYSDTFVFANDFAALNTDTPEYSTQDALFTMEAEQGESRVICYSPDHSLTFAELSVPAIEKVIACWISLESELGQKYPWVQIFENKGAAMGCSMPHPHGQVWAQKHLPTLAQKELDNQSEYFARHRSNLLLDYARKEIASGERVVASNADWLVVVPFWAAWPFETLLLPLFALAHLSALSLPQQKTLAEILKKTGVRYDNLFQYAFPYSMGWHSAPMDGQTHPEWQLHAHFYPPLLRSAAVRKFMVGYEMMAEAQRDMTPEQAAQRLRELSDVHYKKDFHK